MEPLIIGAIILIALAFYYQVYHSPEARATREKAELAAQEAAARKAALYAQEQEEERLRVKNWHQQLLLFQGSDGLMRMKPDALLEAGFVLQRQEEVVISIPASVSRDVPTGRRYISGSNGASVRIAKGVTIRTGGTRGHTEQMYDHQRGEGLAVVTTKRIIFHSDDLSFSEPLTKVATVRASANTVTVELNVKSRVPFSLHLPSNLTAKMVATYTGNPHARTNWNQEV